MAATTRSISTAGIVGLAVAALAAGCGGSTTGSGGGVTAEAGSTATTAPAGPSSALGTQLPQAIQDAGVLRVATASTAAPVDAGLAKAAGKALGVRVRFVETADPVAAVATGRADVGWASLPDRPADRRRVTFVDYLRAAGGGLLGVAVKKSDGVLVTAVQATLRQLQSAGTYASVLAANRAAKQAVAGFTVDGG